MARFHRVLSLAASLAACLVTASCASASNAATDSIPSSASSSATSPTTENPEPPSVLPSASVNLTPPGGGEPVTTATAAIAIADRDAVEINTATLYSAKLVTYGQLVGPVISGSPPEGRTADETVWAVTFVHGWRPALAGTQGQTYDWGCLLVDPKTGAPAGTIANNGAVPVILNP